MTWRDSAGLAWRAGVLGARAAPLNTASTLLLTAVAGALPAVAAWLAKELFDRLAAGTGTAAGIVGLAVASTAVAAGATVAMQITTALTRQRHLKTTAIMEAQLFARVNRIPGLRPFEDPDYLDRVRLAQEGTWEAPGAVIDLAVRVVQAVVGVGAYLSVVLRLWPPFVALLLGGTVLALWGQNRLARFRAAAARRTAASDRRRYVLQQLLLDTRAAKELRLHDLGGMFHGRMMAALRRSTALNSAVAVRDAIAQCVIAIGGALVAGLGTVIVAGRIRAGQASVGDLAFLTAAIIGLQAVVSDLVETYGRTNAAVRLFAEFERILVEDDDLTRGSRTVPALRTGIEFRDVWFRYAEEAPWVLRGLSMTIPHGQALGLVGVNGAGKSTIVKLLCRFYDPERGAVLWDGVDLRDLDLAELRRRLSATYQDYMEFDLTAAENVGIGDAANLGDRRRVRHAAALAEIDSALTTLPRGYDTILSRVLVDEEHNTAGVVLSGGQWQRVALARSLMLEAPDLLILDEPSAGLDPQAEHRVHAMLRAHRSGRTSLLISHRLSSLRDADHIVVLVDGRIAEQGNHQSLMHQRGRYAQLFNVQARGYLHADAELPL